MSTKCIAVLGTVSVQQYIFQSNRLKEIIGASHLAKHWFDGGLIQAIEQTVDTLEKDAWKAYKQNPSIAQSEVNENTDADVRIIYIGGGNAALLCKDKNIAVQVVEKWSYEILKNAPGLRVSVGYGEVDNTYYEAYQKAWEQLNKCEEALPYGAELGRLSIVRSCSTTGLPASTIEREGRTSDFVSKEAARKSEQAGTRDNPGKAQKVIEEEFKSVSKRKQTFCIRL